jgi:hypothetical protein
LTRIDGLDLQETGIRQGPTAQGHPMGDAPSGLFQDGQTQEIIRSGTKS